LSQCFAAFCKQRKKQQVSGWGIHKVGRYLGIHMTKKRKKVLREKAPTYLEVLAQGERLGLLGRRLLWAAAR